MPTLPKKNNKKEISYREPNAMIYFGDREEKTKQKSIKEQKKHAEQTKKKSYDIAESQNKENMQEFNGRVCRAKANPIKGELKIGEKRVELKKKVVNYYLLFIFV